MGICLENALAEVGRSVLAVGVVGTGHSCGVLGGIDASGISDLDKTGGHNKSPLLLNIISSSVSGLLIITSTVGLCSCCGVAMAAPGVFRLITCT